MSAANWENRTLFLADNLPVLRGMNSDSVDLIYLDPPFNSNEEHKAPIGTAAEGQTFDDTWHWTNLDKQWLGEISRRNEALGMIIETAKHTQNSGTAAYLCMMGIRLLELRRVLNDTGSIYLHCDDTAGHYLKLCMDAVFGMRNFRNEITWQRTSTRKGNLKYGLARDADTILRYSKGKRFVWNSKGVTIPYDMNNLDQKTLSKYRTVDKAGRRYHLAAIDAPKQDPDSPRTYEVFGVHRTWRWTRERMKRAITEGRVVMPPNGRVPRQVLYLDEMEGKRLNCIWTDIPAVNSQANEKTGWKTQKPLQLLQRIIEASSNEGDMVLDPFAGCTTACVAAEMSGRRWIGIESCQKVVGILADRLDKASFGGYGLPSATGGGGGGRKPHIRRAPPKRTDAEPESGPRKRIPGAYKTLANKDKLYGLQDAKCKGCGQHYLYKDLTFDHTEPLDKGGSDDIDNLQLLCGHCNSTKGNGTMLDLHRRLVEQRAQREERL